MDKTLLYYNNKALEFANGTTNIDFSDTQDQFLSFLSDNSYILDFGCGSGRDTRYFMEKGFQVNAIDGSEELCRIANDYTGVPVRCMLFQDLNEVEKYDGIWACSSILHLSKTDLIDVLGKMIGALKRNGMIYTSFKYGDFEGMRDGRYFCDFTESSFQEYIVNVEGIELIKQWITSDVRPGRGEEMWLNIILRKANKERPEME